MTVPTSFENTSASIIPRTIALSIVPEDNGFVWMFISRATTILKNVPNLDSTANA